MKEIKIESNNFYNLDDIKKEDIVKQYTSFQTDRHTEKQHKLREEEFYNSIAKSVVSLYNGNVLEQKDKYNMICLGTRNNYERDCFSKYFSLFKPLVKKNIDIEFNWTAGADNYEKNLFTKSTKRKFMRDIEFWIRENFSEIDEIAEKYFYPESIIKVESLDISPDSEADHILDFNNLPDDWNSKWDIIYSNCLDHSMSATKTFGEWVRILQNNGILIFGVTFSNTETDRSDCCTFEEEQVDKFLNEQKNIKVLHTFDVHDYKHYVIAKS